MQSDSRAAPRGIAAQSAVQGQRGSAHTASASHVPPAYTGYYPEQDMPVAVSGWKCKVLCFGRQAQNILPSEQSFGQCCFSEAAGCAEKENAPLLHKSFKLLSDKRFYNDIPGQDLTPPLSYTIDNNSLLLYTLRQKCKSFQSIRRLKRIPLFRTIQRASLPPKKHGFKAPSLNSNRFIYSVLTAHCIQSSATCVLSLYSFRTDS